MTSETQNTGMSEPTPTTDEVRDTYGWGADGCGCCAIAPEKHFPKFDRWMVEHDRQIAEKAWDDAIREVAGQGTVQVPDNPYRKEQNND